VKDHTLDIYKSDRFFIGRSEPGQKFQTKSISISNGTMIYLFSDGYPDQKGGPYKKKFYYQPYQQLLIKNSEKPMKEQKDELIKAVNEWKGVLDQIDDIMVMGIRL
jgi:serine phosphatase RsbU (regulator of sigma subunit)